MLFVGVSVFFLFLFFIVSVWDDETGKKITLAELHEMDIEELIKLEVSLSPGTPTSVKLAPSVATVITAVDIERIGAATLDEVLDSVPGSVLQALTETSEIEGRYILNDLSYDSGSPHMSTKTITIGVFGMRWFRTNRALPKSGN